MAALWEEKYGHGAFDTLNGYGVLLTRMHSAVRRILDLRLRYNLRNFASIDYIIIRNLRPVDVCLEYPKNAMIRRHMNRAHSLFRGRSGVCRFRPEQAAKECSHHEKHPPSLVRSLSLDIVLSLVAHICHCAYSVGYRTRPALLDVVRDHLLTICDSAWPTC